MVKKLFLCAVISLPASAEISITSSTVTISQNLQSRLSTTVDQLFYGMTSVAGPGIINAAAFSSTIGIQRQSQDLPRFQLEPSLALILPQKNDGDEKLTSLPLYAISLVGGYRLNDRTAIQARAFYLPEIKLPVKSADLSLQPYNFGLTLTRMIKKAGDAWYDPAIITPLDLGYMHGSLAARFTSKSRDFSFDPVGDGSKGSATGALTFDDTFKLKWDVYTFTTGIIVVRQFFGFLTGRIGVLSSLNLGTATLNNTATANMSVSASAGSGANEFKVGDTATIVASNTASFKPVLVSNQVTLGAGIAIGAATLNVDFSQNLQINATAIIVQLGCWF